MRGRAQRKVRAINAACTECASGRSWKYVYGFLPTGERTRIAAARSRAGILEGRELSTGKWIRIIEAKEE